MVYIVYVFGLFAWTPSLTIPREYHGKAFTSCLRGPKVPSSTALTLGKEIYSHLSSMAHWLDTTALGPCFTFISLLLHQVITYLANQHGTSERELERNADAGRAYPVWNSDCCGPAICCSSSSSSRWAAFLYSSNSSSLFAGCLSMPSTDLMPSSIIDPHLARWQPALLFLSVQKAI